MVAISDFIKPTQVFSILLNNRFLIIFGVENTHTHFDQNSNLLIEFILFRIVLRNILVYVARILFNNDAPEISINSYENG